jgi:hypothetical protein
MSNYQSSLWSETMSETVELSDQLVLDAERIGAVEGRSAAEQIECWAKLGRAIEQSLGSAIALELQKVLQPQSIRK